mmetsp:Transcript_14668/g.10549  ORF Transcript_14668/g.10549 Transcript_14668/m.10549 type:complete len:100 (+) Transcript_14668:632-931(+)
MQDRLLIASTDGFWIYQYDKGGNKFTIDKAIQVGKTVRSIVLLPPNSKKLVPPTTDRVAICTDDSATISVYDTDNGKVVKSVEIKETDPPILQMVCFKG